MRKYLYESRALHLTLLAVPFVIVVIAWGGLTRGFPVFQFGDEQIHYDIVRQVVAQWPRPLLWGYPAWSGPAVYWLIASIRDAVRRLACGRATHRDGDVLGHLRSGLRHSSATG